MVKFISILLSLTLTFSIFSGESRNSDDHRNSNASHNLSDMDFPEDYEGPKPGDFAPFNSNYEYE